MTEWNNPLRLLTYTQKSFLIYYHTTYKLDLQKMANCFSLMDKKNLPNA